MNKHSIAQGIVNRVEASKSPSYKAWRIGITQSLQERYEYWNKPEHWMYWQADSLTEAEEVESYFINTKHMQGGTGGQCAHGKVTYVYIF
ncbi:MAG: hypothetical protein WC003_16955 [Terrimicrobiaceae bacterium]